MSFAPYSNRRDLGELKPEGEAHLNLLVFQEADKPKVMPEKHGVTLVIPADKPIDPVDLRLGN